METFVAGLLDGKTAYIAGGTSGINLGIARGLAAAGAKVGVISRKIEKVEAAVAELAASGAECTGWAADVRDYTEIEDTLRNMNRAWGPTDIVVSGATETSWHRLSPCRQMPSRP